MWWLRIRKNISASELSTKEQGVPAHIRVSRQGHQCQKEEVLQDLTVKMDKDSILVGGTEGSYKPRHPVNRAVHRFTGSQELTQGSSKGTVAQEVPETFKENMSCVAPEQKLAGQLPLSICLALLQ